MEERAGVIADFWRGALMWGFVGGALITLRAGVLLSIIAGVEAQVHEPTEWGGYAQFVAHEFAAVGLALGTAWLAVRATVPLQEGRGRRSAQAVALVFLAGVALFVLDADNAYVAGCSDLPACGLGGVGQVEWTWAAMSALVSAVISFITVVVVIVAFVDREPPEWYG